MKIVIQHASGKRQTLEILPNDTSVHQVKATVSEVFFMDIGNMELMYEGRVLEDGEIVSNLPGIDENKVLHLRNRYDMEVLVQAGDEGTMYSVRGTDTVGDLIQQVHQKLGVKIELIKLTSQGHELDPTKTLIECDVQDSDIIHMQVLIYGGSLLSN